MKNNKGFSLFTVLIAVSFVGILGLLVLYMALSNFNMKVTDLKGKDSFYTAERAIEEIRPVCRRMWVTPCLRHIHRS